MLRKSLSHWTLLIVTLLLIALVHFGGAIIGWWPAAVAEGAIGRLRDTLHDPANKTQVDLSLKFLGFLGSAIGVAYGLVQAYRLGNRRLPSRLAEYLNRSIDRVGVRRDQLLQTAQSTPLTQAFGSRALWAVRRQRRHYYELRREIANLESEPFDKSSVYHDLQQQFDIASKADRKVRIELATAHFIRGLKFARAADAGQDTDKNRKDAIAELTKATQLDAGDAQIFRACVTERRKANQLADLDQLLGGWVDAAMGSRQRREVGIANLELGKYWSDRSVDPSLTQVELKRRLRLACYSLEAAVEDLQAHPEKDGTAGKDRALADALQSAGDARAALNNHSTAHRLYWQALSIYRALVDVSAVDRVKAKIASVGGHMSDDGDGSSPPPPRLNLVNAQVQLGEALISCGENVSAQATFNTARRTLREEVTTNELTDEHRQDINAEIDDGLKRASQNSQTA